MGLDFDMGPLFAKLEELDKKTQKEISDKSLMEVAEVVLKEQEKTVPKDTRKLKNSLKVVRISGTGTKRKATIGIDPKQAEEVRYGYYQEHGTDVMLGKKWMRRAWNQANAREKLIEALKKNLGGK